jgi:hypothetical protein
VLFHKSNVGHLVARSIRYDYDVMGMPNSCLLPNSVQESDTMPQYLLKALCHLEPLYREQLVVAERTNVVTQFALEFCNAILSRGIGVWRSVLSTLVFCTLNSKFHQRHECSRSHGKSIFCKPDMQTFSRNTKPFF